MAHSNENLTILLVDDSESDRQLYKAWLAERPYRFLEADDGESGLTICQTQHVDCILLDAMMVQMDGFQLLSTLRNQLKLDIPIIFLSSFTQKEAVEDALALGANVFLAKSDLSVQQLESAIEQITHQSGPSAVGMI